MRLALGTSIKEIISGMTDVSKCAFNSWRIPKREATEAEVKARLAQYWSCASLRRTGSPLVRCKATLNAYVAAVPQPCASRRFPRVQSCISMAGTPPSPPVDAGCASCAACIRSSFAKSCAGCASMRRQRFTGGGREVATVTVASGTVTVAISTCCGNCNPHPARVATNTARDICYAKRVANCSNAVWPRYSERVKCNALVPDWFTKRTFIMFHQASQAVKQRARGALH